MGLPRKLEHTIATYHEMRKRGMRVVIGGDYGFTITPMGQNARDIGHFVKFFGYSPAEALRCATTIGGELMGHKGELGVIKDGALADLLLVDGNPLPTSRFSSVPRIWLMIMKDGRFHRGACSRRRTHRIGRAHVSNLMAALRRRQPVPQGGGQNAWVAQGLARPVPFRSPLCRAVLPVRRRATRLRRASEFVPAAHGRRDQVRLVRQLPPRLRRSGLLGRRPERSWIRRHLHPRPHHSRLLAALFLDSGAVRGKKLFRIGIFLPYAIPAVISTLLWSYLYGRNYGPVAQLARGLGVEPPNFLSDGAILFSLANVAVWQNAGYYFVVLYAALHSIPRDLADAAEIDGASRWTYALYVKVPLIAPTILVVLVLATISTLQLFNEPWLLRIAAPDVINIHFTPNIYAFGLAFVSHQYNYSAAISFMIGGLVAVISYLVVWAASRRPGGSVL